MQNQSTVSVLASAILIHISTLMQCLKLFRPTPFSTHPVCNPSRQDGLNYNSSAATTNNSKTQPWAIVNQINHFNLCPLCVQLRKQKHNTPVSVRVNVTTCCFVHRCQHEGIDSRVLWNAGTCLPNYTVSYLTIILALQHVCCYKLKISNTNKYQIINMSASSLLWLNVLQWPA